MDFRIKRISIGGKEYRLEAWDTSGQERYRTVTKSYFERAMGVILVYDCTDEKSFADVRNWMKQLENNAREDIVKILVSNKVDLPDRKIDIDTGKALAAELGMDFIETSAKVNQNVEEAFNRVAEQIINKKMSLVSEHNGSSLINKTGQSNKKSQCC